MIQTLELFGGVGAPRAALRNIGYPVKAIDYVEIDEKAVMSYNSMFEHDYIPQNVVGWNLRPDILIHGSPCQSYSIAGKREGADEGSGTLSSLMWETIKIIKAFGEWKPKIIIWENVKNVRSKYMVHNHEKYINELSKLGYTSSFELLDARDFGIPQSRQRYFTVSVLGKKRFDFDSMERTKMRNINEFLQPDEQVPDYYTIVSPSMTNRIVPDNYDNAPLDALSVIKNYAMTITTKQDRCPNSGIVKRKNGQYRLLTELECWRLMGFSDEDFKNALKANPSRHNKKNGILYKQAGNSMCVNILESIFKTLFEGDYLYV